MTLIDGVIKQSLFAELLAARMDELGVSIKHLAGALDVTYEHARRLTRGEGVPSGPLLEEICEALGIDFSQAQRLTTADKIRKKYGDIPLELAGKKASLAPIEHVWDVLTSDQQNDVIAMVEAWASRNRANHVLSAPANPDTAARLDRRLDHNTIKDWLDPKLESMGLSAERFARKCGLSKATIYFYRADVIRPDIESMTKMCAVLGVPLEEGLAQYTPKRSGRPKQ